MHGSHPPPLLLFLDLLSMQQQRHHHRHHHQQHYHRHHRHHRHHHHRHHHHRHRQPRQLLLLLPPPPLQSLQLHRHPCPQLPSHQINTTSKHNPPPHTTHNHNGSALRPVWPSRSRRAASCRS